MTGVIATIPRLRFTDATGAPLVGGTVTVYAAGTTTQENTWQDRDLTILNENPIPLDGLGSCVVWLNSAKTYKIVVRTKAGASLWTQDNIVGGGVDTSFELSVAALQAAVNAVNVVLDDPQFVAVAGGIANVNALGPRATDIATLAPRASDLQALGPRAGDMQSLAPRASDIATLTPRATDIGTLAPRAPDIGTLAPQAANIGTVAGGIVNVGTVAGSVANVNLLAANLDKVNQAIAANKIFASTADALSKGVASLTSVVNGSGGTSGTFDLAFSGGVGTGAAGRFTVAAGAIVPSSIIITATGRGYTSAPTVSFAASAGLTGASATAVIANNADVTEHFLVPDVNGDISLYRVDAGPIATQVTTIPASSTFPLAPRASSLIPAVSSVDGAGFYQRQRGQGVTMEFDPQQLVTIGRALRSAFPYSYSTPRANLYDLNMIPVCGQSNGGYAIDLEISLNYVGNDGGLNGEAVIPSVYRNFNKFGNLMLSGSYAAEPTTETVTPLIPLVPISTNFGEIGPRFGIADGGVSLLRQAGGFTGKFILSNANVGGQAIENLMPGGPQQAASFWRACRQIAQAKAWAATNLPGQTFGVPYVPFIHGENGANAGSASYASKLVLMYQYINGQVGGTTPPVTTPTTPASFKAASGQSADIPLYITQHHTNSGDYVTTAAVNQKQYEAARDNAGIRLVAPTYPYVYRTIDGTHYSAPSSYILGLLFARAHAYEVATGQKWQPLQPITAETTHVGGVITLYMNSPFDANLVFDHVNVPQAASNGFQVFDSGGSPLAISSVVLGKRRSVVITYTGGTAASVAYAQNATYACQGNLRNDSLSGLQAMADDNFGEPLQVFDWCVSFKVTV